jgi:hypothetical protein
MKAHGYDTNLAAEFFVLSCMHRLGLAATLTLGNRKSVDIVVVHEAGDALTIDVKGLAGKTGWPVDNVRDLQQGHFLVFVCYLNRISDPTAPPEVYVVPSVSLEPLVYHAPGGRRVVPLSRMRDKGAEFRDAWHLLRR